MAEGHTEGARGPGLGGRGITEAEWRRMGAPRGRWGGYMVEIGKDGVWFMAGNTLSSSS